MFNDEFTVKDESENPSSMLLMDIIKAQPKESKEGQWTTEKPELIRANEKLPGDLLEHFITEHESVIQDNFQLELNNVPAISAPKEEDVWENEAALAGKVNSLRWWERVFGNVSIGIEINSRLIRAAKVRTWGKKQEIVQLEEIQLDESKKDDTFTVAQHVKHILRRLKATNIPITSIVGGPDVNLRLLRMPKISKKEIHEALLWKNKKELHFFNDAPTILHYVILDEDQTPNANEFYVLVIAVKEDLIKSSLEIMERAKVLPSKLMIRPIAQWNFIKRIPDKGMNSLVIDVGFENTHLTFYRENTLQFAREIPVGGNHFTTSLMQTIFVENESYILSWDEAEVIKKDIGLPVEPTKGKTLQGIPYSEIAVMMRPVAEKLASEIRMSLDYYKENFKVEKYDNVYFTGNSIRLKQLRPFLESSIGQQIRPLHLSGAISVPDGIDDNTASSLSMDTIGAALSKGSDLNFLPPNAKKELKFRNAYSKVVSGLLILLAILGGSLLFFNKKDIDANNILSILNNSLNHVRYENREYDQLQNEKNVLNVVKTKILDETRVDSSMISILKWISAITPEEIAIEQLRWGNAYSDIEMRRTATNHAMKSNNMGDAKPSDASKALHVKGVVYKDVFYADIHLLNFITAMEKNPFFQEVQLKEKQRSVGEPALFFELVVSKK